MANTDAPFGFKPVGHQNGTSWNGVVHKYLFPGKTSTIATNVFPGDMMKLIANAASVGEPTVDFADATTDVPVGPVVSVEHDAAIPSRKYATASTDQYVYIADSPDLIMEVQCNGTLEDGDIGCGAAISAGSGSATTQRSAYEIAVPSSAASTHQMKILQLVERDDPKAGAANALGADAKVLVTYNFHEYGRGAYMEQDGSSTDKATGHVGVHA